MIGFPPTPRWLVWLMASPLIVLAGLALVMDGALGPRVVAALSAGGLATLLLRDGMGRTPALIAGMLLWIGVSCLAGYVIALAGARRVGVLVALAGAMGATAAAARLGLVWGRQRYGRLAHAGRPIREWEWVFVGRAAALSHRVANRKSIGLALSALYLMGHGGALAVALWLAVSGVQPLGWGLSALTALVLLIDVMALIALVTLAPVAYPLMFASMIFALPFSLPLMMYWADGVRPNLIYRYRFERLAPLEET